MLYYDRIDASGGIYMNECIKRVWYFKTYVCNRCHNVLMMSINFSDIAVLNINSANYRCIINWISRSEVVSLLQKADFNQKIGTL